MSPIRRAPVVSGSIELRGMRRRRPAEKRMLRRAKAVAEECATALNSLSSDEYYNSVRDRKIVSNNHSGYATNKFDSALIDFIFSKSLSYVRGRGAIDCGSRGSNPSTPPTLSNTNFLNSEPSTASAVGGEFQRYLDVFRGYGHTRTTEAKIVYADRIDLPEVAGTVDLVDILPDKYRDLLLDESRMVLPKDRRPEAMPRAKTMVAGDEEHVRVVRRLVGKGMVRFMREVECVNGYFGVDKDPNADRFIASLKPGNACFSVPEKVELSGPDVLGDLEVAPGTSVYKYKYDIRACFHKIRTPRWMHKYFALKPVKASEFGLGEGLIYPCLTTLPMGFAWSPLFCQEAHKEVLRRIGFRDEDLLRRGGDGRVDRLRHGVYLDDGFAFGVSLEETKRRFEDVCRELERVGLEVKREKCVEPGGGEREIEVLGMRVNTGSGRVGLEYAKLWSLVRETESMLKRGFATGRELERLIGKWSWTVLVSRSAFSVFSSVYSFIQKVSARTKLWPSIVKELKIMCGIAPLLSVNIFQEWSGKMAAFDASTVAQGVSERQAPVAVAKQFARCSGLGPSVVEEREILDGVGEKVKELEWQHVVSSKFRHEAHINVLEAAAGLTTIRRAVKDVRRGKKFVVFGDSAAVIAAFTKGRCSSFTLLVAVRRVMALVLATGSRPRYVWIPSKANPADEPSRNV